MENKRLIDRIKERLSSWGKELKDFFGNNPNQEVDDDLESFKDDEQLNGASENVENMAKGIKKEQEKSADIPGTDIVEHLPTPTPTSSHNGGRTKKIDDGFEK